MTGWSWENSLSGSWLLATETGMCRVCQEARLALDRPGETTAGEVAIQLLSAGAVDTLVAAVVEALATDRRLEVAVLAPSGPGAWRVIAAANSDRHGDKVIAERFPELSAASRTGLPARRGLRSMSPDPRTPPTSTGDEAVALALPVWFVPGHAEPVM
ncbi:MAG: hypothetical protein GW878_03845, partial [Acidobacteria bacterium]|nr:hypothetical protein [Acidobacteriota bacterium]